MDAIEVVELRKTYSGGVEALRGVSFSVRAGEIFALLGPNGAGKSTTVRILATLSASTAGTAKVMGLNVATQAREVRRRIGYIAQASGVDISATGRENLLLQGHLFRLSGPALRRRTEELLDLFRLTDAADRRAITYSGGMKRRLDVAMGLVHQPEVLFLDEPTTGLDPESRAVMWAEVRKLARDGLTLLLTTHYLEEADQLAQRLLIIDGGQVVAEGTPDELKAKLHGDRVSVDVSDRSRVAEAHSVLGQVEGVVDVLVDGDRVFAQVSDGARSVPTVLAALERAGLTVDQVALSRPSLEDVYLHATGHAYRQTGAAGAQHAGQGAAAGGGRRRPG
jgi:ABC-2 type transport system ATP-binding protein